MKKNAIYTVQSNVNIAKDVYIMRLLGPTDCITAPGQFINIQLGGFYLRRPISVCRWDAEGIEIIYKVLGRGTAQMALYAPGTQLDVLAGLGNGFNPELPPQEVRVVLVGGGVGVPPLYGLALFLKRRGITPKVVLGFASAQDVFFEEEFRALGCEVEIATEDGTRGTKGYVTNALQAMEYDFYYCCGPQAMLHALHTLGAQKGAEGQLSFEERMGCGFGACMGCSCETLVGPRRVCVDGPVFNSGEVAFT